jgi:hypothetical protein
VKTVEWSVLACGVAGLVFLVLSVAMPATAGLAGKLLDPRCLGGDPACERPSIGR